MKRRIKLTSIYLYVISLIFSCSRNTIFSKGYNYEINLSPIEIAYWFEKNRYNRNECITVHISYGHDGVIDNIKDENKNLPFCLYLDYGNENSLIFLIFCYNLLNLNKVRNEND